MAGKKETDAITGTETTGHEWDGIKELNTPLPRWWLYVLYATIIWSIGYWIVMPAWPTVSSYTKGVIGYSQRATVAQTIEEAREAQSEYRNALRDTELAAIQEDPTLLEFAMAGGQAAFGDNCAPCHGSGAQGFVGYPNLNDDDWIWGGTLDDIHHTIRYGIRSNHDETRFNEMPAFVRDGILDRNQAQDVVAYVLSLNGQDSTIGNAEQGAVLYEENCAACHGEQGEGIQELGAPNLTNGLWLYGGDEQALLETISNSRNGVMPAWVGRLDDETIKQLVIYVHSLGGGQ